MRLRSAGPATPLFVGAAISVLFALVVGLIGSCGPDSPPRSAPPATASPKVAAPPPSPAGSQAPVPAPGYSPVEPVIESSFADPTVIQVGTGYHAYGTNDGTSTVPVATAPSVTGPWKLQGDALPKLPGWATGGWTWAPEVVPPRGGQGPYLMYFSARRKDRDKQCVGVATAPAPGGPFVPVEGEPMVCPLDLGGAIDPSSFVEDDGTRYLLYKSDARKTAAIHLVKLSPDGLRVAGPPKQIMARGKNDPVLVESPDLVKRSDKYVLFYSAGWYFKSNYQTRYATASSLTGPYTKSGGALQSTDGYGKKVSGPGGADVVSDQYGDHLVFHSILKYHGGSKVTRGMYVAALGWEGARPVLRGVPSRRFEAERARLNGCTTVVKRPKASGGHALGPFAKDGCRIELEVFAPSAGRYTARVHFANRSGEEARQDLAANGGTPSAMKLRETKGDDWATVDVQVELTAGRNTLALRRLAGLGQLDYIELR